MYDTTFKCTYQLINDTKYNINDDNDDCIDINDLSDTLYRNQFFQAFKLDEWDAEKINKTLEYIENLLKNDLKGEIILKVTKQHSMIPIDNTEILVLCSYDYFYLFHDCLIELLNNKSISENTFNLLIDKLKNN